ncbi:MAG: hypothetical protein H5T92_08145, partial [Synergistales bacterium]|nr:hypothetical protein [Synergistales bacterium]
MRGIRRRRKTCTGLVGKRNGRREERDLTKARSWKAILAAVLALMLVATFAGCSGGSKTQGDEAERVIRKLVVLSRTQGEAPHEFETLKLLTEDMKKLGLDVELRIIPWDQLMDVVWYQRDKWDMTGWDMIGRPERSDPDEFLYNMFHSSTAKDGYNFPGFTNPEYDKVVEQQRSTIDREQRRQLVFKAQEIIAQDVPIAFFTYPKMPFVFNSKVWDSNTMVDAAGLG